MPKPKVKTEVYRDADDQYRWRVKSYNGKILADSGQGYKNLAIARNAFLATWTHLHNVLNWEERPYGPMGNIRLVPGAIVENAVKAPRIKVEVYRDIAGEYRWRVKHDNGHILADSGQGYQRIRIANDAIHTMWTHLSNVSEWGQKNYEGDIHLTPVVG